MERKQAKDFLKITQNIPFFDVRSPGEYECGHIPGAISMPLFDNEERAIVGTLYKKQGRKKAIKKGLDIVGPKMRQFIEQAEAFGANKIALYCWRGGMRSDSMAWLMERYGFETILLDGGYKAYRRSMLNFFSQPLPLVVIGGYTGSKKTHFLKMLEENGAQIIDLEGLANHQGSSFGNKKCTGQPTTEQFQNQLFETFRTLDLNRNIFIEDEDMRLGAVNMQDELYRQMGRAPLVFLDVDKKERVQFLVEDYGGLDKQKLIAATNGIRKRLGEKEAREAITYIETGELLKAADIIVEYYDRRYRKSVEKKKANMKACIKLSMNDLPRLAKRLSKLNLIKL